jgi:DNA-binding response OmpR family regulator
MTAAHSGPMRVLIVEDEVKMARLMRRGLRDDGMAADAALAGSRDDSTAIYAVESSLDARQLVRLDLRAAGGFETQQTPPRY